MNLHVLHLIDSLTPGGAERMLVDIANQTISEGAMASVCVTRSGVDMASELDPKIELNVLNRQKRFDLSAMKVFSSLAKKQSIDVVHCHGRSSFSLAAASRAIRDIQIPLLLHDHYGKIELDDSIPIWFRIWGRHHVAQYVGVSESLGRWAVNAGVKATKINVIENALNLFRINQSKSVDIRTQLKISKESIIGIVIAGLRYEKGIDYLIEVLSHCKTDRPFHIVIIGGERERSYLRECSEISERLGLLSRIFFVGEKKDSAAWIQGADFGLIPSRSESGPLVLIEYMAAGLPVVASLTGAIAHTAAANGVPGFAECGNKERFSDEIMKLCNLSADARKKRGELGKKVAEDKFDIRRTMMEWFRIYQAARNGSQS